MKSSPFSAFIIALKIWLVALGLHTLAGSFILSHDSGDFMMYACVGGVIGGFFSAPIFIILWVALYRSFKRGRSAPFILKLLFTIGITAAFAASGIFSYMGGIGNNAAQNLQLFFLAPVCGALAIFINYQSIHSACLKRDEADMLINKFGMQPEPTTQP